MKKLSGLLLTILIASWSVADEWVNINSANPIPAKIELINSDITSSVINVSVDGFYLNTVKTPNGDAYVISLGEGTPILQGGSPDLPKLTTSLIIPDMAQMSIEVLSSSYKEFNDYEIAPSKGNFTRDIDPATVPYTYGKPYQKDEFFPGEVNALRDPYIVRDYRGQTIIIYPFQYNPVSKTLRVYTEMKIKLFKTGDNGFNTLVKTKETEKIDYEFSKIYSGHFLNYEDAKYTPVEEQGNMLIISYGSFMTDMQPFVDWKNTIGIPTEMVDVATIGNSSAIKTYIANYYNTNGLTYVLLVGDAAQVPSSYSGGDSDNDYSYIVGSDHYPDVFIGRFSAENTSHVQTQVQRTIDYEQNPTTGYDWYTKSIGIASSQGPGDDNEYDYEHVRNMQTDLLGYTYTYNYELFDGSQGGNDAAGNPTPTMVGNDVNSGASIIVYTGHGSTTSWGSSGFSNTEVNTLTNNGKLPFIWSVACVNGNFVGSTCFGEAWLRATNAGEPSGAIATLMSTINQSWNPPMEGQDEMVDILVESYTNNIKRSFGGLSMNGCMKMNDTYGSGGDAMTDTWTCFGDPSVVVRTAVPQSMTVSHNPVIFLGSDNFTVNCNVEGALVCLTINNQIIGTEYVSGGSATVSFDALTSIETVTIAVTAYNYIPYLADVDVVPASGPYIVYSSHLLNDAAGNNNGLADYGESILLTIELENSGTEDANDVSVVLSTTDPYVSITDNSESYGNILSGQSVSVTNGFSFDMAANVPDGHVFSFSVEATSTTKETWTSTFNETAHAPVLEYDGFVISDPSGNNNGKLDPGETVNLAVTIANNGSSAAYNVIGQLVCADPYITINSNDINYGSISGGGMSANNFSVTADAAAPAGHLTTFLLNINADLGITGSGSFEIIIGQIPVLIVDLDDNYNSGTVMETIIQNLGVGVSYTTTFPTDMNLYSALFVCLGIYSNNYVLSATDGQALTDYLNSGGMIYMEGGDTWYYDPQTAVQPMFNINATADGTGDMGTVLGQAGTFTEGMTFIYSGENSWMDHLDPVTPAFSILTNQSPSYGTAVAYDAGTYKTIGTSHEFGGLNDGSSPSTKEELMYEYLNFFGLMPPTVYTVNLKAFLEGPVKGTEMETNLNLKNLIPNNQPFSDYPWYYSGTENVGLIPNSDVVDWVLVEYRDAPSASSATSATMIGRQAAFLLKDGSVVDLDGSSNLQFNYSLSNQLYVVIYQRNHLGILSNYALLELGGEYNYDFTSGVNQAYGGSSAQKQIVPGIWGMISGDGNCDGEVSDLDITDIWATHAGEGVYEFGDYNLDGNVDNIDKDDILIPNLGSEGQMP